MVTRGRFRQVLLGAISFGVVVLVYQLLGGRVINRKRLSLTKYDLENIENLRKVAPKKSHIKMQEQIEDQVMEEIRRKEISLIPGGDGKPKKAAAGIVQGANGDPDYVPPLPTAAKPKLKNYVAHLDLKGAPPKMSYLKHILPFLKKAGVTGILIEYEDMFPYHGFLRTLPATNAYTRGEILELVETAKLLELDVIPLIQTFGHMEFLLKDKNYAYLREVPSFPSVVCPTHNDTQSVLKAMIDQVMDLHKDIKWLHIGSDEVYDIGKCDRCQQWLEINGSEIGSLFLEHVKSIANYIHQQHRVQPIMWDDEFRSITESVILESKVNELVEIMVWFYDPNIEFALPPPIWEKYTSCFRNIWIASSFKGATGAAQHVTDIKFHLSNHVEWLHLISKYSSLTDFRGFALTGWSRYDHFSVLCELLPVGIPSLIYNIVFLQSGIPESDLPQKVGKMLGCTTPLSLDLLQTNYCDFPGSAVYTDVQTMHRVKTELEQFEKNNMIVGWLSNYNVLHRFSNPRYVNLSMQQIDRMKADVTFVYNQLEAHLAEVYDLYTVQEFLAQKVQPLYDIVNRLFQIGTQLKTMETHWPKRPLEERKEL